MGLIEALGAILLIAGSAAVFYGVWVTEVREAATEQVDRGTAHVHEPRPERRRAA